LSYTASGFGNNDPTSTLTGALGTVATSASPVGSYAFTLGSLGAGKNYNVVLAANPPSFAVTPAPLTILPDAGQSKVYGAAVPPLTYTASGFVNNDPTSTLTGALGTTATAASPAGPYDFTTGSLSAGRNYNVVLAANAPAFAVTLAPPTVPVPGAPASPGTLQGFLSPGLDSPQNTALHFVLTNPAAQPLAVYVFWGDSSQPQIIPLAVGPWTFFLPMTHRYSAKSFRQHRRKPYTVLAFVLCGPVGAQTVLEGGVLVFQYTTRGGVSVGNG
jgi:hypothetical protein